MSVTYYETVAVVDTDDLAKEIVKWVKRQDRRYDGTYRRWIVRNPHRYLHIPAFQLAHDERHLQSDFLDQFEMLADAYSTFISGEDSPEPEINEVLDQIANLDIEASVDSLVVEVTHTGFIATALLKLVTDQRLQSRRVRGEESLSILETLASLRERLAAGYTRCPCCGLSPLGKSKIQIVPPALSPQGSQDGSGAGEIGRSGC
jgi:hypothetical protein